MLVQVERPGLCLVKPNCKWKQKSVPKAFLIEFSIMPRILTRVDRPQFLGVHVDRVCRPVEIYTVLYQAKLKLKRLERSRL